VLNSGIILGTKNRDFFTKNGKIACAILTQNYDHLPCGTPVMVVVRKQKASLASVNIFPARANVGSGCTWLPENVLKFIDKKPLCETHKLKDIDSFDYSQFNGVIEAVKEYGGISFVADKKKAGLSMLNSIQSIIREYKYHSLFQYNTYKGRFLSGKDDNVLNIISFFDFVNCIPLFNMKKIDGMCISFSQVIRKNSELLEKQLCTFRLDVVVSNYNDNIFMIDGTIIDQKHPITNAIYKDIKNYIKKDLPVEKDRLKQKSKKQSKNTGNYVNVFDTPLQEIQIKSPDQEAMYVVSDFSYNTGVPSSNTSNY
jgi:hypothetical protein